MTDFFARHLGAIESDRDELLASLGFETLDQLSDAVVPQAIRLTEPLALPAALSEYEVQRQLAAMAARNNPGVSMIGLGYHATVTPPVLRRMVLENPAWYTAYTPYQPEISQGRLEALANFQTVISDLSGLPVAGASLLDEGTAVAEAVALARRASRNGDAVLVDPQILPQSLAVLRTRCAASGVKVEVAQDAMAAALDGGSYFAVVVQVPGADGSLPSHAELVDLSERAHQAGAQVIAVVDLLALTMIGSAAEWGVDIAVGSAQRFGVPLFYGGPHAGFIAVRSGLERQLPGRIVGLSKDADGVPAFRLALQTREQHIRREKATSNICTAQVLLAVVAGFYAVHHGAEGLTAIAMRAHSAAKRLAATLVASGFELASGTFFDTLTVHTPGRADQIVSAARAAGIHLRLIDADQVGVSIGEGVSEAELAAVASAFGASAPTQAEWGGLADHHRSGEFLTHPVFRNYRSETELMRYLRTLADRDFALDKGMIPLGSCTLKLNPAAAMEPISYPGFAGLHPFVPADDANGYAELVEQLCAWLAEITGYDQVSLQPNAGSQGEFAGLMAIRSYHLAQGQGERVICLIPASAHGTNAASAVLAGMRVVVVATAADGSVDLDDLRAKIDAHADQLAAVMVTYPSTHGVFEDTITEICERVHAAGGQVYVDGANLNAMLGLARPGRFGADVSHLNLHKTFAIPHGGGGPGVGPVAVRAHLAPFLPNHPLVPTAGPQTSYGPVSSGPFGSAGVLPISWAFIALMGPDGLKLASQTAILAANYVAHRLAPHYPVLYTGASGLVAHECIIDLRELSHHTGVSVDDVAKRLIDFGFHAPTMSFPVAGTLMIEPTESESKAELDRFCDAMIAIRAEMDQVAAGVWPSDDNPLHNAPHPVARVLGSQWNHPYSRDLGAFPAGFATGPVGSGGRDKYWPAVGRIDGAYGDRNLICTCAPVSAYEDQTGEL